MTLLHYALALDPARGGGVARAAQNISSVMQDQTSWPSVTFDRQTIDAAREGLQPGTVLHLHGVWHPTGWSLANLAASVGVPIVLSPHGSLDAVPRLHHKWRKHAVWPMVRRLIRSCAAVHVCSKFEQVQVQELLHRWRLRDVDVVEVGLPIQTGTVSNDSAIPRQLVAMVGLNNPIKRGDLFLEGEMVLSASDDRATCVWLGGIAEPAQLGDIFAAIESQPQSVHRFGWIDSNDMSRFYERVNVVVVPSDHENFSLVAHEALSHGAAIVATDQVGLLREFVGRAGVEILRAPVEPEELAVACAKLIDTPPGVRQSNAELVRELLRPESLASQYAELYESAVSKTKADI